MKLKAITAAICLSLPIIPTIAFSQAVEPTKAFVEPSSFEVGVMLGDMRSNRKSVINPPFATNGTLVGSNLVNGFETGLQIKKFLTPPDEILMYIYMNAVGIFSSENMIFNQAVFPGFNNSTITLSTPYIVRLGFGFDTTPFDGFTGSAGFGIALVRQTLSTTINEVNTVINSVSNNTMVPTAMVGLNYKLCSACINGHPFFISGLISAEQYPTLQLNSTGSLGIYQSQANGTWQFNTDLVFSTRF